eukprot:EG_transcript_9457
MDFSWNVPHPADAASPTSPPSPASSWHSPTKPPPAWADGRTGRLRCRALLLTVAYPVALCGVLSGAACCASSTFPASAGPFAMAAAALLAIGCLLLSPNLAFSRTCLYAGLLAGALGTHFLGGAPAAGCLTWAVLAPLAPGLGGAGPAEQWAGLALAVAGLVLVCVAEFTFPPPDLPHSPVWPPLFQLLNVAMPAVVLFSTVRAASGPHRLAEARCPIAPCDPEHRVLAPDKLGCAAEMDSPTSMPALQSPLEPQPHLAEASAEMLPEEPDTPEPWLEARCRSFTTRTRSAGRLRGGDPDSGSETLQPQLSFRFAAQPSFALDGGPQWRPGTLLYGRLLALADATRQVPDPGELDRIHAAGTLFSEAVVAAARETQAHVHRLSHDVCLLSWNLTEPCRHHADHACQAAVAIRKRLQAAPPDDDAAPPALSIGVWAGQLVSGVLPGPNGAALSSVVGLGVEAAVALQRFAAASGRAIVANAEANQHAAQTRKWRLLPVDVVCLRPWASLQEAQQPVRESGA